MPRTSPKRSNAESVLADPTASALERAKARRVIAMLDARSAYMSEYERRRRENDPAYREKRRASKAGWKKRNPDKVYASVRRHHNKRAEADPKFRIDALMRATVNRGLRGLQKRSKYLRCLDWTFAELRKHIEAQFADGMTWENWGSFWELDHVVPRSQFAYDGFEHQGFVECWSMKNLRPTPKAENRRQGYVLSYGA